MNVVAIIQARMLSSRFPGKHLSPLHGKPMIRHVVSRCEVPGVNRVIVATSDDITDDPLNEYLISEGITVFRGSLSNPLSRMYCCAARHSADWILRVTGDCPLVDSRTIEEFVGKIDSQPVCYYGRRNSPDGNDVEIFDMAALRLAFHNAGLNKTEHTTTWIQENMECESVNADPAFADIHYSVNTIEDLRTCELLIARCGEGARWQDYCAAYRELKNE